MANDHRHSWQFWSDPHYERLAVRFCKGCDTIEQRVWGKGWASLPFPFSQAAIQLERMPALPASE